MRRSKCTNVEFWSIYNGIRLFIHRYISVTEYASFRQWWHAEPRSKPFGWFIVCIAIQGKVCKKKISLKKNFRQNSRPTSSPQGTSSSTAIFPPGSASAQLPSNSSRNSIIIQSVSPSNESSSSDSQTDSSPSGASGTKKPRIDTTTNVNRARIVNLHAVNVS